MHLRQFFFKLTVRRGGVGADGYFAEIQSSSRGAGRMRGCRASRFLDGIDSGIIALLDPHHGMETRWFTSKP